MNVYKLRSGTGNRTALWSFYVQMYTTYTFKRIFEDCRILRTTGIKLILLFFQPSFNYPILRQTILRWCHYLVWISTAAILFASKNHQLISMLSQMMDRVENRGLH